MSLIIGEEQCLIFKVLVQRRQFFRQTLPLNYLYTLDPKVLDKYADRFPKADFLAVKKTSGDGRTVQGSSDERLVCATDTVLSRSKQMISRSRRLRNQSF